MKKRFLKSIAALITLCILVSLGGMSAANNKQEVEVIVCDSIECLQKRQLLIDVVSGGTGGISPMNLLCLFGHSTTTTTVIAVTHNAYATSPKCRQQTYRIIYCTRSGCNYNVGSLIGDIRIPCCP